MLVCAQCIILVSCEVSGGVVVQTYSKPIKTAKNVLRWLLKLALMVNNICEEEVNPFSLFR